MLNVFDTEALVNVYRMLDKKCKAIDKFINNHAFYVGPCTAEYGAIDVCNNIINLMTRKNQLINLKLILDATIDTLDNNDKKIIYIKTRLNPSINVLCEILDIKERTAFRRIERAFENLTIQLNKSKYLDKLSKLMNDEIWISTIRDELKDRRLSYSKSKMYSVSIL